MEELLDVVFAEVGVWGGFVGVESEDIRGGFELGDGNQANLL